MIKIYGARQNNLKDVTCTIPHGKLTVVTGVSGSGKSSLAFDSLYAEGQRRYVESFSTYARQFLERMDRPDLDRIDGLLPAVAIEQRNTIRSSRSTLGTLTELTDYLKVLYAKLAKIHCPTCHEEVTPDHPDAVADRLLTEHTEQRLWLAFPFQAAETEAAQWAQRFLQQKGYWRVIRDGRLENLDEEGVPPLSGLESVLVDRLIVSEDSRARLIESIEMAYRLGDGRADLYLGSLDTPPQRLYRDFEHCGQPLPSPREGLFSFSSPIGACGTCRGFGRVLGIDRDRVVPNGQLSLAKGAIEPLKSPRRAQTRRSLLRACEAQGIPTDQPYQTLSDEAKDFIFRGGKGWRGILSYFAELERKTYRMHVRVLLSRYRSYQPCEDCGGTRFQDDVWPWRLGGEPLPHVLAMTVREAKAWAEQIPATPARRALSAVYDKLVGRLDYLERVGLGYLSLDRQARTLSGGEVQRANLTTTLGSGLVNTLFVLDEPTIGLHPEDADRLAGILQALVSRENTVVLVEHDPDMLKIADHILELGPGPGRDGGEVVYQGPLPQLRTCEISPTRNALEGLRQGRPLRDTEPPKGTPFITIKNAQAWNLKGIDVRFPLGQVSVLTGRSGSGKSTLMEQVLYRHVLRMRGDATEAPGRCDGIEGLDALSDVVWIDQSPPQGSSRANPATYIGVWDYFRQSFARTDAAKARDYGPSTFSFNTGQGRCPACEGSGVETIEMQFLADVHLACEVCEGRRFKDEVLDIKWQGLSIADCLSLTVSEAMGLIRPTLKAFRSLKVLDDVGLGYMRLGQPLSTLSGGEAQRLKLAAHLASSHENVLYLLDEPTTGLHLQDVARLNGVLRQLADKGHTVLCVEHHLDVVAEADWVIDLGPEGGDRGGELLFMGPPAQLAEHPGATGRHLRRWAEGQRDLLPGVAEPETDYKIENRGEIVIEGARSHNLKDISVRIPRAGRTVVSGVSGSGKSTLVFDIIFAEGQRRFLDCLSAYARQFIEQLGRADADRIEGIPPTVAIEQRTTRGGSRSNVANVTEIEPFLRILWARLGAIKGAELSGGLSLDALHTQLRAMAGASSLIISAPVVQSRQGYHDKILKQAAFEGYEVLVNGRRADPAALPRLRRRQHHDIDFIIGEARPTDPSFLAHLEEAARIGRSQIKVSGPSLSPTLFQIVGLGLDADLAKSESGFDPRYFSSRTSLGRCEGCEGLGSLEDDSLCGECGGSRLGPIGRSVRLGGASFPEVLALNPERLVHFLEGLPLSAREREIARGPIQAISERVGFLNEVGLGYLGLDRMLHSLSGGEAQRIRLAAQLGAHLSGVLYVLDEPTIGLHPTDTDKLLRTLDKLEARQNGILMVEHDETTIRSADLLIDIGPGAGRFGGQIMAQGPVEAVLNTPESLTGKALASPRPRVQEAPRPIPKDHPFLSLDGVQHHTLDGVKIRIPRGRLTVISGVSGSGKSSLVDVVMAATKEGSGGGSWKKKEGFVGLESLVQVDDKPIGKNPRSTPATYVGVWDEIRKLFAAHPESKVRGYGPGRFSFNVKGGRCEACQGAGQIKLEMSFLPDAYVSCDHCHGTRYAPQTLQVAWEGQNIHDILEMSVSEALAHFERVSRIKRRLQLLEDVGLGYLKLGQPSPTLSGGEAQRIKLVSHLVGRGQPKTVLVLDEPSIGLHMADLPNLLRVIHRLVDMGATVLVVEHNTDIIREADWNIDMGPGPGEAGGEIVYEGPYEGLVGAPRSETGRYLLAP